MPTEKDVRLSPRPGSKEHKHAGAACWCWTKTTKGLWRSRPGRIGEGKQRVSILVPGLTGQERKKRMKRLTKQLLQQQGASLKSPSDGTSTTVNTQQIGLTSKTGQLIWNPELELLVLGWASEGKSFRKIIDGLNCKAIDFWHVLEHNKEFGIAFKQACEWGLRTQVDEICDLLRGTDGFGDTALRRAAEIAKHLRWYVERVLPDLFREQKTTRNENILDIGKTLADALLLAESKRQQLPAPKPMPRLIAGSHDPATHLNGEIIFHE